MTSPATLINKLRIIKQVLLSKPLKADESLLFDCPVCNATSVRMVPVPIHYFEKWQQYKTVHNPFYIETMNIAYYMCSKCFCFDRERLFALYLQDYLKDKTKIALLDIAPGKALGFFLKHHQNILYRSMDKEMDGVDDLGDITDMHFYQDNQFDFFICSHVLEHIPDDIAAMKELYRVLKKGGKGIVMVPINLQLETTMEDPSCTDDALRWKYFFQDDHVRMYSKKDFISRLSVVGFTVEQLGIDYFSKEIFDKNAIWPTSVLYVVHK